MTSPDEVRRRRVEALHSQVAAVVRRLDEVAAEAERVVGDGALPAMLSEANESVVFVRDVLQDMVIRMNGPAAEGPERSDPKEGPL